MTDKVEEGSTSGDEERASLSDLARRLAASRKVVESTCEYCGKPITGTTRRKYCSQSHSVLAYRKRLKERETDLSSGE
jgi:hypothetical protein